MPNAGARPKRMSLVNNCLFPGLWELSASDSVGEMWHAWMTLPPHGYFELVRAVDGIDAPDAELADVLDYHKTIPTVAIDFARLRTGRRASSGRSPSPSTRARRSAATRRRTRGARCSASSTASSARGKTIAAQTFGELQPGDVFQFFSFVPPGIYTQKTLRAVPYEPIWTTATLREVTPRTRFGDGPSPHTLRDGRARGDAALGRRQARGRRRQPADRPPRVPGGLRRARLRRRRHARVGADREAPPVPRATGRRRSTPTPPTSTATRCTSPTTTSSGSSRSTCARCGAATTCCLRVTLVAYERIVDILEVDVKLPDELAQARSSPPAPRYQRPLWRSFSDSNLL